MSYAYLDIETSWQRTITVIGIYRPGQGTAQLVAPHINRRRLLEAMDGVTEVLTYNGSRFDLPVIESFLGVALHRSHKHRDLMFDCWKHKLKGGLKRVEQHLGIHRDSEGIDGLAAMKLWASHERACRQTPVFGGHLKGDCCNELEVLLRYNREDCENLEILHTKLCFPAPMGPLPVAAGDDGL